MPAADQKHRHLVGHDARQDHGRPQRIPERPVVGRLTAGDGIGDQRSEVPALITSTLSHRGKPAGPRPRMLATVDYLQRRVDDVEQAVDRPVSPYRAQVRRPAHRRRVAIEIACGHHREDRLQRRTRPDGGSGEQLVDRQVGGPEHADTSVGVRQLGSPLDQLYPVLCLPFAEHLERTPGDAAPPDVDHHLDVAALDQVRGGAAADLGGRRRRLLAVGRHTQQHRERAGGGLPGPGHRGVIDVDAQHNPVAHRHPDVVPHAPSVQRRPGCPGWRERRVTGPADTSGRGFAARSQRRHPHLLRA